MSLFETYNRQGKRCVVPGRNETEELPFVRKHYIDISHNDKKKHGPDLLHYHLKTNTRCYPLSLAIPPALLHLAQRPTPSLLQARHTLQPLNCPPQCINPLLQPMYRNLPDINLPERLIELHLLLDLLGAYLGAQLDEERTHFSLEGGELGFERWRWGGGCLHVG